jgi:hypothetical protein
MSKKHYIAIAAAIWDELHGPLAMQRTPDEADGIRRMARRLTQVFWSDNPRFDRKRFLDACGIEEGD